MPNPVSWFEIPATDLARARKFYEHVLACEMSIHDLGPLKMAWFPAEQDAPHATGSLVQADSYVPSHHGSMVYFSVDDIDEALVRVESAGGTILNPKTSIGAHGFVAHFQDTEGNRVALHATH